MIITADRPLAARSLTHYNIFRKIQSEEISRGKIIDKRQIHDRFSFETRKFAHRLISVTQTRAPEIPHTQTHTDTQAGSRGFRSIARKWENREYAKDLKFFVTWARVYPFIIRKCARGSRRHDASPTEFSGLRERSKNLFEISIQKWIEPPEATRILLAISTMNSWVLSASCLCWESLKKGIKKLLKNQKPQK